MKLQTSIKARKDGTVKAMGLDGNAYVFAVDAATGELSCDVTDDRTAAMLLSTGNFWPENQADLQSALALVQPPSGNDHEEDDGEDEPEDDVVNALPIEAGTPPAPKAAKKHKASR